MVDPLPRWARAFFLLLALVAVAAAAVWRFSGTEPKDAYWRVDPSAELDPTSRTIPIVVLERSCASGRSPTSRLEVDISYSSEEVHLDVGVRPLRGDQDCQGIPDTPHDVDLREPLGGREVTGESWPDP